MAETPSEKVEQTPDEPVGMPCKACGHDLSDHKTSSNAIGYPCVAVDCLCPFFQG